MPVSSIEESKDLFLRMYAKQLRAERPGLTHARSYQLAQEQHPELREEFASETAASAAPYRYQPSERRKAKRSEELPEEIRRLMNQRVQADKTDSGEVFLVMASNGEVVGLELE